MLQAIVHSEFQHYRLPTPAQAKAMSKDGSILKVSRRNSGPWRFGRVDPLFRRRRKVFQTVFKELGPKLPPCLTVFIGLHDVYREGAAMEWPMFVMSKPKEAAMAPHVCIPDTYALSNYFGKLAIKDDVPWRRKLDLAFFAGSSTGDTAHLPNNVRLSVCDYALKHPDTMKCHITQVVQTTSEAIHAAYPRASNFILPEWIDQQDHYKYKYLINIDGNTCAWDRLPWILNSNSLCIKLPSTDYQWWHKLMSNRAPLYVQADTPQDIPRIVNTTPTAKARSIVKRANAFARKWLKKEVHMEYLTLCLQRLL